MRLGELLIVPWFLPGVGVSVALGILLGRPIGRRLGIGRGTAVALVVGLGIILSATLTPLRWALDFGATGSGACNFSRLGLASLRELLRFNDTTLNVLLFVPLGVAVGIVPWSRRKAILLAAAIALPFAIETIQLLAPALDRACESGDVVDNLSGLVIGLGLGWLAAMILTARDRRPR